jgi:hypothetical protein
LTTGQSFRHQSFVNDSPANIVIEVCSTGNVFGTLDYSVVRFYIDTGEFITSQCNLSTEYPTITPLPILSDAPSSTFSSVPTNLMSSFPSSIPSISTPTPTQSPTTNATISMFPSRTLTLQPIMPPIISSPVESPVTISSGSIGIYMKRCTLTNLFSKRHELNFHTLWILTSSSVVSAAITYLEGQFLSIII